MFSTGNRKRVQSTSESTFMYFRMYFVLSIVLCTFKCTLKSTRCTFDNVRKHDLTFSKNQKRLLCTCNFLYEYQYQFQSTFIPLSPDCPLQKKCILKLGTCISHVVSLRFTLIIFMIKLKPLVARLLLYRIPRINIIY